MRHARANQAFPDEWTPILRFGNWYHLAGVYGPNRTQLFVYGILASEYRSPTSYLIDVPNAELHIGHDVRFKCAAADSWDVAATLLKTALKMVPDWTEGGVMLGCDRKRSRLPCRAQEHTLLRRKCSFCT